MIWLQAPAHLGEKRVAPDFGLLRSRKPFLPVGSSGKRGTTVQVLDLNTTGLALFLALDENKRRPATVRIFQLPTKVPG